MIIETRGLLRALKWDGRHLLAKGRRHLPLRPRWRNVVFVVGCGRSGTTLLGEMLSDHPDVRYLNEPRDLWSAVDPITDDIDLFAAASRKLCLTAKDASDDQVRRFERLFGVRDPAATATLIEKLPQNCFRIEWLRRLAPHAKFVHIVRNWPDVVASIAKLSRDDTYTIATRRLLNRWWGSRYSKLDCFLQELRGTALLPDDEALSSVPNCTADFEKLAASEWYASVRAVQECATSLGDDYLEVQYEDLIRDPVEVLTRIHRFIPLAPDRESTELAARRVRETQHTSRTPAGVHGKIRDACDRLAATFGYETPVVSSSHASARIAQTQRAHAGQTTGILFERFGPYHHARARAAASIMRVHAIEIFRRDSTYAWEPIRQHHDYPTRTLFDSPKAAGHRLQALWQALDDVSPTVLALPGWGHWYSNAALAWAVRNDVRVIVMSETTRADRDRAAPLELTKEAILKGFDAALVGGTPQWRYLAELGFPTDRIELGYDAVDNEYFMRGADEARRADASTRERYALPARYFLTSCRLIRRKNIDGLIRAFAIYRQRATHAPCDLVVVGDGPERASLESLARALDVAHRVHFMGFRQYPELPSIYGLAQAFVLPSTREPWGLVVNEAMASGIPVIVSEAAGCARDLAVPGMTGWRFAPQDFNALASILWSAGEDVNLSRSMGDSARRLIAKWGPERFSSGLEAACNIALTRPRTPLSFSTRVLLQAVAMR